MGRVSAPDRVRCTSGDFSGDPVNLTLRISTVLRRIPRVFRGADDRIHQESHAKQRLQVAPQREEPLQRKGSLNTPGGTRIPNLLIRRTTSGSRRPFGNGFTSLRATRCVAKQGLGPKPTVLQGNERGRLNHYRPRSTQIPLAERRAHRRGVWQNCGMAHVGIDLIATSSTLVGTPGAIAAETPSATLMPGRIVSCRRA